MKVNELMIGDWVDFYHSYEHEKKIVTRHRVTEIFECGLVGLSNHPNPVHADHIEPVKITPEILEKNGFVEDKSVGYCERYIWADSMRLPQTVVEFSFGDDGATMLNCWIKLNDGENNIHICDPSYVHQLQHALRLCGIEKEIIL